METVGLYPKSGFSGNILLNYDVAGVVRSDFGKQLINSIIIKTSSGQDKAMQNYLNRITSDPGNYNLGGYNCASFAKHVLNVGGIKTPDTILPSVLMQYLQNRYSQ